MVSHTEGGSWAEEDIWAQTDEVTGEWRRLRKEELYDLYSLPNTTVGTLIVVTIYLQLIQNRYVFQSFTVLQCSHQHCVQPVASDVEVLGYL